jgi:hypothetical protein
MVNNFVPWLAAFGLSQSVLAIPGLIFPGGRVSNSMLEHWFRKYSGITAFLRQWAA